MNPQATSQLDRLKFLSNDIQVEIEIDQLQQQITFRMTNIKNKNFYESTYTNISLPQQLKTLLSNVKTLYDYIEVNRANQQKVIVKQTGHIHLVFLLAFGPQSQIKKQVILQIELKQIGKVQGCNIQQLGDRLRQEMIELNKKHKQERQKLKLIILSVEKTNQKLICESEQLKLENIEFKKNLLIVEQKLTALQILLKDLYSKYYTLKEDKEKIQKRLQKTRLVAILPSSYSDPTFKKQINSIFQESNIENYEQSYIRKIKTLEEQRDQQRKVFELKIAQKDKKFNSQVDSIERSQPENSKKSNYQLRLLSSDLKDSDIQQLKNTVSPHTSSISEKSDKEFFAEEKFVPDFSSISDTKRKVGLTGKFYCGGTLCRKQNCCKCKTLCGPNLGQNCAECMKSDIEKKGLKKGFLVNRDGQVSWMQNGRFCCGIGLDNGAYNCGINDKYCQACNNLSEVYEHRYKDLLQ